MLMSYLSTCHYSLGNYENITTTFQLPVGVVPLYKRELVGSI